MKVSTYVPATKGFVGRISSKVRDKFVLRESILLLFLKTLFKICQFGFMFLMARYLSQEEFGDFQFVAGTINLITQPAVVLTLVVARIGCSFPLEFQLENIRWFFERWKAPIIALSCAMVFLFVLGDGVLIEFGKIEAHGSFAVAGITIVASLLFYYYMGFLQAMESFKAIGLLFFLTGGVTFILGIGVVWGDLGILTVYGTEATARIIALVVTLWLISKSLPKQSLPNRLIKFSVPSYSLLLLLSMFGFFCAYNMDIFTLKVLFDRTAAGHYMRMDLVGKLMFLLGSTLAIIIFPRSSKAYESGEDPRIFLLRGTLAFFAGAGLVSIVIIIFQDKVFGLIFGGGYRADSAVLAAIITARVFESYIFILLNYLAAIINRWMLYSMVGLVIAQGVLLAANHGSLLQVSVSMAVASVLCTLFLLFLVFVRAPAKRSSFQNTGV